jgi:hypothetical protein
MPKQLRVSFFALVTAGTLLVLNTLSALACDGQVPFPC